MAETGNPKSVKFFFAILYKNSISFAAALRQINCRWGEIDLKGTVHTFDITSYYEKEMGSGLLRQLVALAVLRSPAELAAIKLDCIVLEKELSIGGKRIVNIDCGYLDDIKVVLASAKAAGQKIYLQNGIYADMQGRYSRGRYQPFPWSFPDFKAGWYDNELLLLRKKYLQQLHHMDRANDLTFQDK
ncbi:MAG: DUF4416 family protein [Candidatus Cloacimonetes bacterium]|nr:DUF4416 family protein [Candidatus Cloacimonadota bacterium]